MGLDDIPEIVARLRAEQGDLAGLDEPTRRDRLREALERSLEPLNESARSTLCQGLLDWLGSDVCEVNDDQAHRVGGSRGGAGGGADADSAELSLLKMAQMFVAAWQAATTDERDEAFRVIGKIDRFGPATMTKGNPIANGAAAPRANDGKEGGGGSNQPVGAPRRRGGGMVEGSIAQIRRMYSLAEGEPIDEAALAQIGIVLVTMSRRHEEVLGTALNTIKPGSVRGFDGLTRAVGARLRGEISTVEPVAVESERLTRSVAFFINEVLMSTGTVIEEMSHRFGPDSIEQQVQRGGAFKSLEHCRWERYRQAWESLNEDEVRKMCFEAMHRRFERVLGNSP